MKRIVWTFGLIAGAVMAVFMIATMPFVFNHGINNWVLGYAVIVAGFLFVYLGVRSYRDNVLGGTISFGRAFSAGILIAAIASVCYVATWEVIYYKFNPNFYRKFAHSAVARAQKKGLTAVDVAKVQANMDEMLKRIENPLFLTVMVLGEPFPVGLLIALVSAGVLRRRPGDEQPVFARA